MSGEISPAAPDARRRGRFGLLLCLLSLLATLVGGGAIVVYAVDRAQTQFEDVLDEKALSRARRIQRDMELAIQLDIPLAEIRGMWEYTAKIPEDDADIRFVAISGPDLQRLHYGGIGRERLDPLLADPVLRAAAMASVEGDVAPEDAVTIDDFSIITLALLKGGELQGFVHVAVQQRQLRERLFAQASRSLPMAVLALLLVIELASFAYAAGYREPLERLERLLLAAERTDGSRFELSARHGGGELGTAMFRFNALMHRLARRAGRFLGYADEVRRAVFEPSIVAKVETLAAGCELGREGAAPRLQMQLDARPSDLWPALVLGTGILVAVSAAGGLHDAWFAAGVGLAGILVGLFLPAMPAILATLLLLLLQGTESLFDWLPLACLPLALAGGMLVGQAAAYARRLSVRIGPLWLGLRLASGVAAGLLAAASLDQAIALPLAAGGALLVAVASLLLRGPVRHLALAGGRSAPAAADEAH